MIRKAVLQYLQKQKRPALSPKAVLFDMDGVLYDSMPFHARAWLETAVNYNLQATPEDFYLFEGCTGERTIDELFYRTFRRKATTEEKERIYREKADLFNACNDGHAMKGADEVLKQVKA
jgi:beta-phosphoglucomutase-like phosphatase (HAD superfamily)